MLGACPPDRRADFCGLCARVHMLIYIDQSPFVQLFRAATKHPRAVPGAALALDAVRTAVSQGAVVALTAAHYHEVWHDYRWERRHGLAGLMRDLSGYSTLAPIQTVTRLEIASLLTARPTTVVGRGANHAFSSRTGRLVITDEERVHDLYPTRASELERRHSPQIEGLDQRAWEWFNLAGPAEDFPLTFPDGSVLDPRPEHARGDDWAQDEEDQRAWLAEARLSHHLSDFLVGQDIKYLLPLLNEVAAEHRVDPRSLLGHEWPEHLSFHASLASRWTLVELRRFRLKERQYRPHQHDRLDLLAHAVALPYCDIVLTEKRTADLARKAKVAQRFGTQVISKVGELSGAIEAWIPRTDS